MIKELIIVKFMKCNHTTHPAGMRREKEGKMNVIITGKRTIGWVIKGESKNYNNVKCIEKRVIKGTPCTIIFPSYGGEVIVSEKNYSISIC